MRLDVLLLFWEEFFPSKRKFTGMIKLYEENEDIFGYFSELKKRWYYEHKLRLYYFIKS